MYFYFQTFIWWLKFTNFISHTAKLNFHLTKCKKIQFAKKEIPVKMCPFSGKLSWNSPLKFCWTFWLSRTPKTFSEFLSFLSNQPIFLRLENFFLWCKDTFTRVYTHFDIFTIRLQNWYESYNAMWMLPEFSDWTKFHIELVKLLMFSGRTVMMKSITSIITLKYFLNFA